MDLIRIPARRWWQRPVFMLFGCIAAVACGSDPATDNYPQFRGATSDAVSAFELPVQWSASDEGTENVRWRVPIDGEGWSQPIVWDDRVYLTTAMSAGESDRAKTGPEVHSGGYGRDRADLMKVTYRYEVFALDADTGNIVWRTTVKQSRPPMPRHSTNTYATETPVTDGERIVAYFGMNGVHCLDMDGNLQWQKDLGVYEMRAGWGTASSPVLSHGRVYVQVDNQEESFLTALDARTGDEIWRTARQENSQYSSPMIWRNSLRDELIVGGTVYRSYDPATGKLLWEIDMDMGRSSATPVAIGDALFVGNEFRNRGGHDDGGGRLYRIVPGGSGDITPRDGAMKSKFVPWRMDESGIQMASPTHAAGNLYFFERRRGVLHCIDAESGRVEYETRVPGASAFWASPWTDNRHVYALDSDGNTHVIKVGDEFEVVQVNRIEEMAWGTPALAKGRIYLRTANHLYCIERFNPS